MFARLFLALVIALLSLPAAAAMPACHGDAPQAAMADMHHGHRKQAPAVPIVADKLCLGCVAPATAGTPRLSPPLAFAAPVQRPALARGEPRASGPPLTPPPRSEA
ncbi:hypothetical protein [Sphingomonas hengshuiensis]|uniref:DUF2946 domain-containing protein n=1 Tax=Sphingomonas hengshuiensis TaxID=1609977 RepID=A0A7U5BER8_9SPHN|nr:hypothetical protein [Sphingomonas hengshuiensis]AJP70917.1 hypothetical protein TS85_02400 [Sphingomonas hengshuiensis]